MPFLAGNVYADVPLTRAAIAGMQKDTNFVAMGAFPRFLVDKPSGIYNKWILGDLNRDEMKVRSDNAPAQVASFGKETATYAVPTESLAYDLNDTVRAAADASTNPATVIPRLLGYKALLRLEGMLASLFSSSVWFRTVTGGASDSVSEGATSTRKRWSLTDTDPIVQLLQEIEFQGKLTGFEPDGVIFGRKAWTAFRTNPYVLASLSGTGGVIRNRPATLEEVASLLELRYVRVSKAIKNTAGQGLAASNARIVPEKSALLYYRGDQDVWTDSMPVAAAMPTWADGAGNPEGLRIRRFRDEKAGAGGSDHSEIDTFRTCSVVTSAMGTLFEDMAA